MKANDNPMLPLGTTTMPAALSPREIVDSGLLHIVNEAFFWPRGLTLAVGVPARLDNGERDWLGEHGPAYMQITDEHEVIVSGLPEDEHLARHNAFADWMAKREVKP